jgi:hypothetical protein
MGRKSRRNRSIPRDLHPARDPPRPKPAPVAREVLAALLQDAKIERMTQAEIMQELVRKHHGDVPAAVCWNHLADRRIAARGASV